MHYARHYSHGDPHSYSPRTPNSYRVINEQVAEVDLRNKSGDVVAVTKVSPESLTVITKHRWCRSVDGYAVSRINGRVTRMHRFLLDTDSPHVDHANRDRLDNTLPNIRPCTPGQNSQNREGVAGKTSMYKGVSLSKPNTNPAWAVYARFPKSPKRFWGYYETELDAARAYNEAAQLYGSEFTHLNDVPPSDHRVLRDIHRR